MDIVAEQNKIRATFINADGVSEFTPEMKELLTKCGYTETDPGEFWFLGEVEGYDTQD